MTGLDPTAPPPSARHRLLLVGRDAADTATNHAFASLVRAVVELSDRDVSVLLLRGGPLVAELAAVAPTTVAADLPRRSATAVVERTIGRLGLRRLAAGLRGRRLGLGSLDPHDRVYLHTVLLVQVLRYLPTAVPVACRVPESSHPLDLPLSAPDLRLLLDRVERFFTTTEAGTQELTARRGVDPRRVHRVREVVVAPSASGSEVERSLRAELGVDPGSVLVGLFGASSIELRAPAVPLAVAIRRQATEVDVTLVLVVPEHTADSWAGHDIEQAGLADSVRLIEMDLWEHPDAAACDVVVHAGWGPDQPHAYLEAAAAGVPVVCSEGDELAEVVGDDEGGFVCPRLDLPALAAAVNALAVDPELRREKGRRAAERVLAAYSPSAAAVQLCRHLEETGR